MQVQTADGKRLQLSECFAEGGEATIWTVAERPAAVAKLFHDPTSDKEQKLRAMLTYRPDADGKLAAAWPDELIWQQGRFAGYLMPKVQESIPIFRYYNPARRARLDRTWIPAYPWPYVLHHVAKNLAAAVKQIHAGGHIIGDLNESNVLVDRRGIVTLVDTDSFQIRGPISQTPAGFWPFATRGCEIHRNAVGKAEFTAPELQGVDFKTVLRTTAHDNFALGVLIFYLLMDGYHPYAGILLSGKSVGRVDLHCLREGIFPYAPNMASTPPPQAPRLEWLHPDIQRAFTRCFVAGHRRSARRPAADEWLSIMDKCVAELAQCGSERSHFYAPHLSTCPQCDPTAKARLTFDRALLARQLWQMRIAFAKAGQLAWYLTGKVLSSGWHFCAHKGWQKRIGGRKKSGHGRKDGRMVRDEVPHAHFDARHTGKQRTTISLAVWLKLTILTWLGTVCGGGLAWAIWSGIGPSAEEGVSLIAVGACTALMGIGSSLAQGMVMGGGIPRNIRHWLGGRTLGWSGISGLAYLIGGLLAEGLFDLPDQLTAGDPALAMPTVLGFILFGLTAGYMQSLWLRFQFSGGNDLRKWTAVNTINWLVAGYSYLIALRWWAEPDGANQIAGAVGFAGGHLVGLLLTSAMLIWISSGPAQTKRLQWSWFQPRGQVSLSSTGRRIALRWGTIGLLITAVLLLLQTIYQSLL